MFNEIKFDLIFIIKKFSYICTMIELGEEYNEVPAKIRVCNCRHCKYVKGKRKNRGLKKKIKRIMNKKRRQSKHNGECLTQYWA